MIKKNKYLEQAEDELQELKNDIEQSAAPIENRTKELLVDFNAWFASRRSKIPVHHYKEIIMADMKARKIAMINTLAKFDEGLEKYGIKLK